MAIETEEYLTKQFANYYRTHLKAILPPPQFDQREFAFFWFTRTGVFRHVGFANIEELTQFTSKEGPAHTFYSAAYYETPDAPQMPLKGWQGADLIFDIDADHLDVPCQKFHDSWSCLECGHRGRGLRPEQCPKCEKTRFDELKWLCENCLGKAKEEAIKIMEDFLIPDFGISPSEITIIFSGHRGYHIHCFTPDLHPLGSQERREIVDFISGLGMDLKFHGFVPGRHGVSKGPNLQAPGWEHKIALGIQTLFQNPDQIDAIVGLRKDQKRLLEVEAASILKALVNDPPRYIAPKGIGQGTWKTIAQHVIENTRAIVDEPVTTDIHRLIRLPGSLNGKTGFLVKKLNSTDLEGFDPFRHAQVFEGNKTVYIHAAPAFAIGGVEYPPMREIKKELPLSAAMLLLCKGVAELSG